MSCSGSIFELPASCQLRSHLCFSVKGSVSNNIVINSKGTSARILEAQTAGFRALLPKYYEYSFYDGEEPFESYKEISDFFPGPYFCYYKDNSMKNVKLAHEYVKEIIEEDGKLSIASESRKTQKKVFGIVIFERFL